MGADGDAELAGRGNGPLHDQRVAAVEAAGDVGRSDQRQQLVVGAELPIAEALAAVAVDVDAVHAGLGLAHARRRRRKPPPQVAYDRQPVLGIDLAEGQGLAGLQLPHLAEIGGNDRGDLGVAAGGRVLDPHHDRLDAARHLDAADRDHVVDDVGRAGPGVTGEIARPRVEFERRTDQPHSHAIRNRRQLPLGSQEGFHALWGEHEVLRAEDHPNDARLFRRDRQIAGQSQLGPVAHGRGGQQLETIAFAQRPSLVAALAAAHIGGAAAQHGRNVDAPGNRQVAARPGLGHAEVKLLPGLDTDRPETRHVQTVEFAAHVGAAQRDEGPGPELELHALHQHFQPGRSRRKPGQRRRRRLIADQEIGERQAVEILGAGRRDAARQEAGAAAILNGRLHSAVENLDHVLPSNLAPRPGRR